MTERKFDYIPRHDPRSLNFTVQVPPTVGDWTSKYWYTGPVLDQGSEGACVGHGTVGALMSAPLYAKFKSPQSAAFGFYNLAKFVDEWEGEAYDGTSVLAGLKVARQAGAITAYRWCTSLNEVLNTVATLGPVVIGVEWRESMMNCPVNGLQPVSGATVGGHCVAITGVAKKRVFSGANAGTYDVVRIRQSWGKSFGNNGNIYVRWSDLGNLLLNGEAALPIFDTYL